MGFDWPLRPLKDWLFRLVKKSEEETELGRKADLEVKRLAGTDEPKVALPPLKDLVAALDLEGAKRAVNRTRALIAAAFILAVLGSFIRCSTGPAIVVIETSSVGFTVRDDKAQLRELGAKYVSITSDGQFSVQIGSQRGLSTSDLAASSTRTFATPLFRFARESEGEIEVLEGTIDDPAGLEHNGRLIFTGKSEKGRRYRIPGTPSIKASTSTGVVKKLGTALALDIVPGDDALKMDVNFGEAKKLRDICLVCEPFSAEIKYDHRPDGLRSLHVVFPDLKDLKRELGPGELKFELSNGRIEEIRRRGELLIVKYSGTVETLCLDGRNRLPNLIEQVTLSYTIESLWAAGLALAGLLATAIGARGKS